MIQFGENKRIHEIVIEAIVSPFATDDIDDQVELVAEQFRRFFAAVPENSPSLEDVQEIKQINHCKKLHQTCLTHFRHFVIVMFHNWTFPHEPVHVRALEWDCKLKNPLKFETLAVHVTKLFQSLKSPRRLL